MKIKVVSILIIIAVILIGSLIILNKKRANDSSRKVGQKLFTELPVNQITRFTLTSPFQTISLGKVGGQWIVDSYYDYPANYDNIQTFLKSLHQMKIGQKIKVRPTSLWKLALLAPTDPGKKMTKGVLVETFDKDQNVLSACIVGKAKIGLGDENDPYNYGPSQDGQYVRIPSNSQVYLVSKILDIKTMPQNWIDHQLLELDPDSIKSIDVTNPTNISFRIERSTNNNSFICNDLKDNQKLQIDKVESLLNTIAYCNFDSIANPDTIASNNFLKPSWKISAQDANGLIYNLSVNATNSALNYMRLEVTHLMPKSYHSLTNKAAKIKMEEKAYIYQDQAKLLNDKFKPWTFILNSQYSDEFRKNLSELSN